jgi:hypothetical protein
MSWSGSGDMLINEAKWLADQIRLKNDAELFPMLNIGSSTIVWSKFQAPWVNKYLFSLLKEKQVVNVDIKQAFGVQLTGDIMDSFFAAKIKKAGFRSILCTNVLEHVLQKEKFAKALLKILPKGGYLFITCPYKYPYHPDPIDTGFRPTPGKLSALFPKTRLLSKAIIRCQTYGAYLRQNPLIFLALIYRLSTPFFSYTHWSSAKQHLSWLNTPFQSSCIVLKKN